MENNTKYYLIEFTKSGIASLIEFSTERVRDQSAILYRSDSKMPMCGLNIDNGGVPKIINFEEEG